MGLDVSHNAFHGAYSSFNRFRQAVCKAFGGRFPFHSPEDVKYIREVLGVESPDPMWWYAPDGFTEEVNPGMYAFLKHSDCDGDIPPATCVQIADEMERLLPALDKMGTGGGHLESAGGIGAVARQFIAGCRMAAAANESLDFY